MLCIVAKEKINIGKLLKSAYSAPAQFSEIHIFVELMKLTWTFGSRATLHHLSVKTGGQFFSLC